MARNARTVWSDEKPSPRRTPPPAGLGGVGRQLSERAFRELLARDVGASVQDIAVDQTEGGRDAALNRSAA